MPKLAWVLLPLALYGAWLGAALVRGRAPSRHALNVQLSVLLMVYLLATAGLGIFWVANQQLPVFDWHYLFGYGTLALVVLHLWFNLPVVWRALRGGGRPSPRAAGPRRSLAALAGAAVLALGAGYLAGTGTARGSGRARGRRGRHGALPPALVPVAHRRVRQRARHRLGRCAAAVQALSGCAGRCARPWQRRHGRAIGGAAGAGATAT